MKILMLSLDVSILGKNSKAAGRMADYGAICDELHIVIAGVAGEVQCRGNVFIYPTSENRVTSLIRAKKICEKILGKEGKWLITCQDPFELGFIGWLLSRKFKIGFEVQLHGDFYDSNYWKKEKIINFFRYYLGKFILKRAGTVRAVSERIRKSIDGLTKTKINEASIPAEFKAGEGNFNFLKNKFPGAYPILFAVGNLVPVKNHAQLIEIFSEIKKDLPGAKLVIAGEGLLLKYLRLQIANLRLEDSVELAGHRNNLADYYTSSDIFVHPSLYEGWGRAVVEAAYYGLPIVMSDVGLAGEIIKNEESGLVVPVNDKEALKAAILRLAKDKNLQKKLAENAKKAVEQKMCSKEEYLAKIKESWDGC